MGVTVETITKVWMDRVWNQLDADAIDELLTADAPVHGLGEAPIIGATGFRQFHAAFAGAFAEIRIRVADQVVQGDKVASRWAGTMVHRSTRTPVTAAGMVILRVANGQVVEAWNAADFLPMLTQLGLVPADAVERALKPA